jgi:hypothetical protein
MSSAQIPSPNADRQTGPGFAQWERRQHQRYSIFAQSEYILAGNRAQATTLNISSGGVFLKTDHLLPVGKRIQVFIDWPVLLDQRCPLRLVMTGRVLRSDEAGAAVENRRYDFKIRPTGNAAMAYNAPETLG